MMPISDLERFPTTAPDVGARWIYEADVFALQAEITRRVADMPFPDETISPIDNAVVVAACGILQELSGEVGSPCVMKVGKDIDPWEERLHHVRSMAEMIPEMLVQNGIKGTDLSPDDPRLAKLKQAADRIGALVSETLEASIAAVNDNALSASSGPQPTF